MVIDRDTYLVAYKLYSHTQNLGDTPRVAVLFGSAAMVRAAAAAVVGCAAAVKAPEGSACAAVMSGWAGWGWAGPAAVARGAGVVMAYGAGGRR